MLQWLRDNKNQGKIKRLQQLRFSVMRKWVNGIITRERCQQIEHKIQSKIAKLYNQGTR